MPGLNSILNSIFGSSNERKLKKYKDQVHAINELEEKYEKFSDEELKDKTKAITPVPGGVGPMTIACLLKNTLECFKARLL